MLGKVMEEFERRLANQSGLVSWVLTIFAEIIPFRIQVKFPKIRLLALLIMFSAVTLLDNVSLDESRAGRFNHLSQQASFSMFIW